MKKTKKLISKFSVIMDKVKKEETNYTEGLARVITKEYSKYNLTELDLKEGVKCSELIRFTTAIKINFSDDDKYVVLSYSVRYSTLEKLSKYARGLVLDTSNYSIVTLPFDRFYNVGEKCITKETLDKKLETNVGYISDKLDGSLMNISLQNNDYIISSKGSLSRKPMIFEGISQLNHVREAYKHLTSGYKEVLKKYSNYTCISEFITDKDEHLVEYSQEYIGLNLIGMRNKETGECLTQPELAKVSKQYNLGYKGYKEVRNYEEIADFVESLENKGTEGVVIYIKDSMYKLKRTDYLRGHKLLFLSFETIKNEQLKNILGILVDICLEDEMDDYISKVKEENKSYILNLACEINEELALKENELALIQKDLENKTNKEIADYLSENYSKEQRKTIGKIIFGKGTIKQYKKEIVQKVFIKNRIKENEE